MDKNSALRIYGVLGYPARHSLSPLMHNAAFAHLKINAEYRIFEKEPVELERFLRSLKSQGIFGLNVTVPYKEKVIPYLDKISAEAQLIAAANTILVSGEGLEGFNTDAEGFLRHLKEVLRFNPEGKNIAIIGAGGASRAVSVSLSQTKPRRVAIYDIENGKRDALVAHLKGHFSGIAFLAADSIEGLDLAQSHLLVNATPIGMKASDPCLVGAPLLHKDLLVYDLIYNPPRTRLLEAAEGKGARVSNGLGMLLYQGMISFEVWTGRPAPKEVMEKALGDGSL